MEIVSIILAAGRGKRMKSLLPKALHKVAGKTLLNWLEDTLTSASISKKIPSGSRETDSIPRQQWCSQLGGKRPPS